MYQGMIAETVGIAGFNGEVVEAYLARPTGIGGGLAGVVLLHHVLGWDEWHKEATRKLAYHGYAAICPHLFHRFGPGRLENVTAAARAKRGTPDATMLGDLAGAMAFLRAQPYSNGKVAAIGFCSGGRQVYLAACTLQDLDAAIDCWGGGVIMAPEALSPERPVAPIDLTSSLGCPLLGLFGKEDTAPTLDEVRRTEQELQRHHKVYEFHCYDNAGHGFLDWYLPAYYRPEAALDAWERIFEFLGRYLRTDDDSSDRDAAALPHRSPNLSLPPPPAAPPGR